MLCAAVRRYCTFSLICTIEHIVDYFESAVQACPNKALQ